MHSVKSCRQLCLVQGLNLTRHGGLGRHDANARAVPKDSDSGEVLLVGTGQLSCWGRSRRRNVACHPVCVRSLDRHMLVVMQSRWNEPDFARTDCPLSEVAHDEAHFRAGIVQSG